MSNLANHSNLATDCWKSVVAWEYHFLVDENALDGIFCFQQIGMLAGGHSFLLHLLLFASGSACFFQCSRSASVGTCSLFVLFSMI